VGALPFRAKSFDGVVTIATIHHVIDRPLLREMIREMARVTVPGGRIILWDHNPNNPYWRWLLPRLPQDAGGVRLVGLRELLAIARALPDVEVEATWRSGAVPEFAPLRWLPVFQRIERCLERCWGLRRVMAHNVVVLRKRG
jgi:SAM-dependent methyltransferase